MTNKTYVALSKGQGDRPLYLVRLTLGAGSTPELVQLAADSLSLERQSEDLLDPLVETKASLSLVRGAELGRFLPIARSKEGQAQLEIYAAALDRYETFRAGRGDEAQCVQDFLTTQTQPSDLVFRGAIDPEEYSEPYLNTRTALVEMTASDLGLLKRRRVPQWTGRLSVWDALQQLLAPLGLPLQGEGYFLIATGRVAYDFAKAQAQDPEGHKAWTQRKGALPLHLQRLGFSYKQAEVAACRVPADIIDKGIDRMLQKESDRQRLKSYYRLVQSLPIAERAPLVLDGRIFWREDQDGTDEEERMSCYDALRQLLLPLGLRLQQDKGQLRLIGGVPLPQSTALPLPAPATLRPFGTDAILSLTQVCDRLVLTTATALEHLSLSAEPPQGVPIIERDKGDLDGSNRHVGYTERLYQPSEQGVPPTLQVESKGKGEDFTAYALVYNPEGAHFGEFDNGVSALTGAGELANIVLGAGDKPEVPLMAKVALDGERIVLRDEPRPATREQKLRNLTYLPYGRSVGVREDDGFTYIYTSDDALPLQETLQTNLRYLGEAYKALVPTADLEQMKPLCSFVVPAVRSTGSSLRATTYELHAQLLVSLSNSPFETLTASAEPLKYNAAKGLYDQEPKSWYAGRNESPKAEPSSEDKRVEQLLKDASKALRQVVLPVRIVPLDAQGLPLRANLGAPTRYGRGRQNAYQHALNFKVESLCRWTDASCPLQVAVPADSAVESFRIELLPYPITPLGVRSAIAELSPSDILSSLPNYMLLRSVQLKPHKAERDYEEERKLIYRYGDNEGEQREQSFLLSDGEGLHPLSPAAFLVAGRPLCELRQGLPTLEQSFAERVGDLYSQAHPRMEQLEGTFLEPADTLGDLYYLGDEGDRWRMVTSQTELISGRAQLVLHRERSFGDRYLPELVTKKKRRRERKA